MGRPKGSKNKKTLEREEFAKRFAELNAELNLDEGKTEIENNNIQYLNQPESDFEEVPGNLPTEKEEQEIEKENNLNKLDKVEVKEAVIETETETEIEEGEVETEIETEAKSPKIKNKKEKQKTKICCERCGKEIYCEPRKIDTNVLTGMADYYRQARRRIVLCDNCCKVLSKLVDDFLIDVNQGGNEELKKF